MSAPSIYDVVLAQKAAQDKLRRFDVILSHGLVEEIVAAECYGVPGYTMLDLKQLGDTHPAESNFWKGKRVLHCGSYLPTKFLCAVAESAMSVEVWPYSVEEIARIQNEDKQGRLLDVTLFNVDTQVFPRATRLIRRAFSGCPHTPEESDNHFYRGLLQHAYAESFTQTEAIVAWLRGEWDITEDQLITDGITAEMEHCRIADDIVKLGSLLVPLAGRVDKDTIWECSLRVVVAGFALVMPVAGALVQHGEFIGVVVRPNLKTKTTSVIAYTEQDADLSWMEKAPWNGGGKPNCKGATLQGLVPLDTLIEWLQQVVPKKRLAPPAAVQAEASSSK